MDHDAVKVARQLIHQAIKAELESLLAQYAGRRTADGKAAVMRNRQRANRHSAVFSLPQPTAGQLLGFVAGQNIRRLRIEPEIRAKPRVALLPCPVDCPVFPLPAGGRNETAGLTRTEPPFRNNDLDATRYRP